ncbi:hypothetical protein CRUP_013600, partial [Coryphaenoides rupestris]
AGCDLDDLDLFTLPNPYNFTTLPSGSSTGTNVFADEYWPHATGTARGGAAGNPGPASSSSDSDLGDLDLYSSEGEDGVQAEGGPPVESTELRNAEWGLRTAVRTQADLEGRIRRLVKDSEGKALKHKQTVAALEREVEETTANIQVTNQEVELFQQKLEEMVRKDQKEKKANQEELKGLKMETEELAGKCTGLSKSVQEKRKQCDKQLMDFCDLSNQSAAKKMSLEEEIKRCDDLCAEAAARSQRAVLSVLENTCRQNLYCLQKSLSDSREILLKIDEVAFRYPPQVIAVFQQQWRSCIQEATDKISMVERQYQEQVEQVKQVKQGARLSVLPPVSVPSAPEPPVALDCFVDPSAFRDPAPTTHRTNALGQAAEAPPQAPVHLPPSPSQRTRPQELQQGKKFDRILEQLATIFPDYTRQELMKFVHTLRRDSGGVLPSGPFQEILNAVSQIILDHQAQPHPSGSGRARQQNGISTARMAPPPASQAWLLPRPPKYYTPSALNMEDPCIICHDDMPPGSCIESWLREQQTCPTCRKHALLPDDFPELAGRRQLGRHAQ